MYVFIENITSFMSYVSVRRIFSHGNSIYNIIPLFKKEKYISISLLLITWMRISNPLGKT